ncbi:hypothetical protein LZ575_15730 [Antarcticibacterium sp. 1MA-6-2]|uniref:hypothetical protein n=1 Tax=Antarcticibacterium sp. 1MA-6-2 TaxID=2908210 RepID=UPI001F1EBD99|nr:hypothetical protein [Antarcticibacterium sp. 1MA-6-2]UJH90297.1 hypothetical protein LZ575_15730 [Antarcticibacterium sp. 1MA-6-2]
MKLLTFLFLLFTTLCFSQKQYEFDYLLEYEVTLYKDSVRIKNRPFHKEEKSYKKYYLTNSRKNNYTAVIKDLDSSYYKMIFRDQDGIYSEVSVLKSNLNKAEFINIDCRYVSPYENPYKHLTEDYEFFELADTLIDGTAYQHFKIASIKPKTVKRKKLGAEFYIIEKETEFHLPVVDFPTIYEEWKTKQKLPNGIFLEKYYIDYYDRLDSKEKLINYWKIDRKIVISEDCDYTREE